MNKIKVLAIFNALSLIVQIFTIYLVRQFHVNRQSVAEISARYDHLFTPAPISFIIWGIIYTALGILCLYHIVIAYKHDHQHPSNHDLIRMGPFFIIANLAASAWLIAWTNDRMLVSLVLMFVLLVSLAIIHTRLRIHDRSRAAGAKTCTEFPLSIYFAWICIAFIANAASYLVAIGWDGMGLNQAQWALIMISVAVAISLFMIYGRRNAFFGFVVAWALYGLILKIKPLGSNVYDMVINTAWLGLGLIVISSLIQLFGVKRIRKPHKVFPSAATPIK